MGEDRKDDGEVVGSGGEEGPSHRKGRQASVTEPVDSNQFSA